MKYDSGNFPVFQQIPKQHNAHVLAYTLYKMDFEQMEMRVASYPRSTIGDMRAADLEKNDSPTLRNTSLYGNTTVSGALKRSTGFAIKFAQQLPMFSVSNVRVHDSFCIDRASVYCSTIPYTEDKDTKLNQTYKKRKHIPNNQEEQKAGKAKLLAKNKFFK